MKEDKDGNCFCEKGHEVGSDTGFKRCPDCELKDSEDIGCILSQAGAEAIRKLNNLST